MPTINQLVRKPRKSKVEKSKSPALNVGYNSHKKVQTNVSSPQKRGVATRVGTMTLISQVSDTTCKNTAWFFFVVDV